MSQSQKQLRLSKFKNTMNQKSAEEMDDINNRRSLSMKNSHKNMSDEKKLSIVQKRIATYQNKSEDEKIEYRQKLSTSLKGKNIGKSPWNKGLTKETDDRVRQIADKTSSTNKAKYGKIKIENPQYFTDWRKLVSDRMRQNNTYGTSSEEEKMYRELLSKYDEDNIKRQYSDSRYPFDCDFYIVSEDLFIELNKHWTHGGHPFDDKSLDDIYQLECWQEKAVNSPFYRNAIYVWTDLDVRKLKKAKENHLNYKVIY